MPATCGPVPTTIHQIWLGSNPEPTDWTDTVREFCKTYGYEYKLWTEKNLSTLPFSDFPAAAALYKARPKTDYAGRADIIRLLALWTHGGVYIDSDSVILKPRKFDTFLCKNKAGAFFAWEEFDAESLRKLRAYTRGIKGVRQFNRLIANGVIGATAHHGFIGELLSGLGGREKRQGKAADNWIVTGPLYTTEMFQATRKSYPDVKIYPMRYFYPLHWHGITDPELHKKVKVPGESMLFQYGYTTNGFDKIFAARRRTRRRKQHA